MNITFRNVTITIDAPTPEDAAKALARANMDDRPWGFAIDTYFTEDDRTERDTGGLFQ